jgi:hypothetical protein
MGGQHRRREHARGAGIPVRAWQPRRARTRASLDSAGLLACFAALAASGACAVLRPFTLPWDDATPSVTNLSAWSPVPACADGWLGIDAAGHFSAGNRRVRILGVNIGASAAFADKGMADAVAARMAKFGLNGVRGDTGVALVEVYEMP